MNHLKKRIRARQGVFRSRLFLFKTWLRVTGLRPPEFREFVPRLEGDERLAQLDPEGDKKSLLAAPASLTEPIPFTFLRRIEERLPPTWSVSSGPNHNDPGWDNVIRALEEDR